MTQESTRADFENWIRKHRPYENIRRKFESDPYPPGVQCYWEGWQAAIAHDRKRRGEPVACFKCGHPQHRGECVNVAPQPAEPVNPPTRDQIRAVFLSNGFTIKPGHDDLKEYVYEAARDLLARYGNTQEGKQ